MAVAEPQVDYDALADQVRNKKPAATTDVDYDALANQVRGKKVDTAPAFDTTNSIDPQTGKGYGLYKMTGPDGTERDVPYNKVMDASKAGYKTTQKERERFATDQTAYLKKHHQGKFLSEGEFRNQPLPEAIPDKPSTWSKVRSGVESATEPTTIFKDQFPTSTLDPVAGEMALNFIKRAGRTLFGVADFGPQAYSAFKDSLSDDPNKAIDGETRLLEMHPAVQITNRLKELKRDWKQDPKLAVENVGGDAVGLWVAGKVSEGAPEAIKSTIGKSAKAANFLAKEVAGIRPKTAADLVTKTMEQNEAAAAKATETNTANTQEHLEKTQEALHKTEGIEREHEAKVKGENEKAQAAHEQKLTAVREHNDRVTAKHDEDTAQRTEHNAALDHTLELRRQREAELEKETDAYYALEDKVKAKAKAEENDAWQPWHEKMEGVTVDGGRIAKALERVTAVSPDAERALRQLIPDPADAAPDSLYAQDRKAVMLSNGYPDETNYWDLPEHKRINIDKIAASSGFEPEPIDFDPQAGKQMSVEQIHRAQSILGRYIRGNRYEGHILGEMKQVQNALKAEVNRASMEHGAMGDLESARKATERYQQAFGRERPNPQTVDEIRKKGANPEQYREEEDQKRVDAAARHSQELVEAHEKVKGLREELREMPSEESLRKQKKQLRRPPAVGDMRPTYRLKPEPKPPIPVEAFPPAKPFPSAEVFPSTEKHAPVTREGEDTEYAQPPTREAPPDRPTEVKPDITQAGEEELTEANRAQYTKTIQALRTRGIWYGAALPWLWVARDLLALNFGKAAMNAIGAGVSSVLTVAGLTKLADILEKSAIRDWVATPSKAEMAELEKLPPDQRKVVANGFRRISVVAKKKGYRVSPLIAAYMAANKGEPKIPDQDKEQPQ